MNIGEGVEVDDTGCVTGLETGRVIARFSHVSEGESFVELIRKSDIMKVALLDLRSLLNAQSDKSCLGTGCPKHPDDCAPWPIVDEAIDAITVALTDV